MATGDKILGVLSDCPRRVFSMGTVLLAEGQRVGVLYFLESGTVEIVKKGHLISTVVQPGAVFGEVSMLLDQAPMATVRAGSEVVCRLVEHPLEFLGKHPEVALHVATLLAKRLNSVTSYLVDLKRQYEDRDDHLGMVDEVLESLLQLQTGRR